MFFTAKASLFEVEILYFYRLLYSTFSTVMLDSGNFALVGLFLLIEMSLADLSFASPNWSSSSLSNKAASSASPPFSNVLSSVYHSFLKRFNICSSLASSFCFCLISSSRTSRRFFWLFLAFWISSYLYSLVCWISFFSFNSSLNV